MLMVASAVDKDWQAGRNRLNHDWLKNEFLNDFDRLVTTVEDGIDDHELAHHFLTQGLQDWASEEATARRLIDSFEFSMSPRIYLEREPLCHSAYRDWLSVVVHALWKSRVGVDALLENARKKLDAASSCHAQLCRRVATLNGRMDCRALSSCLADLVDFRDRCREFSVALGKFPNRVLVT